MIQSVEFVKKIQPEDRALMLQVLQHRQIPHQVLFNLRVRISHQKSKYQGQGQGQLRLFRHQVQASKLPVSHLLGPPQFKVVSLPVVFPVLFKLQARVQPPHCHLHHQINQAACSLQGQAQAHHYNRQDPLLLALFKIQDQVQQPYCNLHHQLNQAVSILQGQAQPQHPNHQDLLPLVPFNLQAQAIWENSLQQLL